MADPPHVDLLHVTITHPRRRDVLRCLEQHDTPVAVADLAEEVAATEQERAISELSNDDVREVHVRLHHVHLPKLDEAGLVEYDPGSSTVRYDGDRRVTELLRVLDGLETGAY